MSRSAPPPASGPTSPHAPPVLGLDVIGDVHGQLAALERLGGLLGYDVAGGWTHPEGRRLLFVGDLVDRGGASLEVCELVLELQRTGRALALMGNHELNLIAQHWGIDKQQRHSNRETLADVARRPERWEPVIDELARLPLAWEAPGLRVIHAVWHRGCVDAVRELLPPGDHAGPPELARHIVLGSPFAGRALVPGLPTVGPGVGGDPQHAVLLKGYELPADKPFPDADGKQREKLRVCWWLDPDADVPRDGRTVFGHYWNLPPRPDDELFAPPHPSGHPDSRKWVEEHTKGLSDEGEYDVPDDVPFVCVDYNARLEQRGFGGIGAYRHPQGQVVFAVARADDDRGEP